MMKKLIKLSALSAALRCFIVFILLSFMLLACARDTFHRGYKITPSLISQLSPDMTKQQALDFLGSPSVEMQFGDNSFYYISSVFEKYIPYGEKEVDREILAIYFDNKTGKIERVAHYGIEDGHIVDHVSDITFSGGAEQSIIKQFFSNLGRFNSGASRSP